MLPFGSHQAPLYRGSQQNREKGNPQTVLKVFPQDGHIYLDTPPLPQKALPSECSEVGGGKYSRGGEDD